MLPIKKIVSYQQSFKSCCTSEYRKSKALVTLAILAANFKISFEKSTLHQEFAMSNKNMWIEIII